MKKIAIAAILLLFAVGAQAQNNVQNKAQNQTQKNEENELVVMSWFVFF